MTARRYKKLRTLRFPLDAALQSVNNSQIVTRKHQRIRAQLKRQKHSQKWLATRLGISPSYVSMLISGQRQPSLALALRLSEETGVPVSDFAKVA